jgi:hypothetical protein
MNNHENHGCVCIGERYYGETQEDVFWLHSPECALWVDEEPV